MIINLEYKKKDPIFAPSKRRKGQWCTSLSSMTPRLMTHSADAILSQLFTQDYHYCTDLVISTYRYDVDAASNVVSAVLTDFCNAIHAHPEWQISELQKKFTHRYFVKACLNKAIDSRDLKIVHILDDEYRNSNSSDSEDSDNDLLLNEGNEPEDDGPEDDGPDSPTSCLIPIPKSDDNEEETYEMPDDAPSELTPAKQHRLKLVYHELERFDPRTRLVVLERIYSETPYAELADDYGYKNADVVKQLVSRALHSIRHHLNAA